MKKHLVLLTLTVCGMSLSVHASAVVSSATKEAVTDLAVTTQKTLKDVAHKLDKLNIRFVNCFDAMQECEAGAEVQKEFKAKQEHLVKGLREDEDSLRQKATEYNSKKATLSDAAREKEEKILRKLENDYKTKIQESEYELKLAMQKSTEALAKDIEEAVAVVAKKDNLDAVVDIMTGRVVYAADHVNITDSIVKEMNVQRDDKIAKAKKEVKKEVQVAQVDKKAEAVKA